MGQQGLPGDREVGGTGRLLGLRGEVGKEGDGRRPLRSSSYPTQAQGDPEARPSSGAPTSGGLGRASGYRPPTGLDKFSVVTPAHKNSLAPSADLGLWGCEASPLPSGWIFLKCTQSPGAVGSETLLARPSSLRSERGARKTLKNKPKKKKTKTTFSV